MNSLTIPPPVFDPLNARIQLAQMVRAVLSRAYDGGIFKLTALSTDLLGNITGNAIGNDRKFLDFNIDFGKDSLTFNESLKKDSYYDEFLSVTRLDRKFAEPKCKIGIRCKGACIEKGRKCRNTLSQLANRAEIHKLRQTALISKGIKPSDDLENKSIRELQELARSKNVYRANHQSKKELIETLRTLEKDPKSQERLRKTLEKRRVSRKIIEKSLPGQLAKFWRNFNQIGKAAGVSPEMGTIAMAAFLMGVSASAYNQVRDRYRSGLSDSANMAYERAQKIPLERTNKPNIMITVGGFAGTGSNGQKMKELLEAPADNTRGERWLGKANHIIPFTHKELDIPTPAVSKRNPDGSYNPAYLGAVAKDGFGKFTQNFQRGRSDAAVDLAAQLYAYGNRYKNKGLNVLGHGAAPTDEAVEILMRMPKGREIAQRLNLVRIGTPSFGFTNDKAWDREIKHRTITSSNDPFSFFPKKAAQWISTVKGHEVDDYLKNNEVRERLRESFNYYSNSITGHGAKQARRKEFGETLGLISPAAGKLWNQLNKVGEMAERNPAAATVLAGAVVAGTGVATYKKIQKNYQTGLKYSATEATRLVDIEKQKLKAPGAYIPHNNVTFTVGGIGFSAKDIKDNLPDEMKKSHFVEVDGSISTSGNTNIDQMTPGSASYNTHVVANGYGTHLNRNLKESLPIVGSGKIQNPEAVQLAAQMYAMADTRFGSKGKGRRVNVNVIAGGDGGLVAREAMQIIERMPNGQQVASRIRVATLGTPTFGLAQESVQERNIVGAEDPVGKLPHPASPISVSAAGVPHHSAKAYLQNKQVQEEIKNHFTRPKTGPTQAELQEKERQANAKKREQEQQQKQQQEEAVKAQAVAKREAEQATRKQQEEELKTQKAAQRQVEQTQRQIQKEAIAKAQAKKKAAREQAQTEKYKFENLSERQKEEFLRMYPGWNPENEDDAEKIVNFVDNRTEKLRKIKRAQKANKGFTPPKS